MKCPICDQNKKGHFDKQSIKLRLKCCDCYAKWAARPENDPDNGHFKVIYTINKTEEVIIYAKTKEEAEEQFYENYAEDNDWAIESVLELEKPDYAKLALEQAQQQMQQLIA